MLKYLALGDSYTIGEQVKPEESFPWQFVQKMRADGWQIDDPAIVAKTGWTSNELQDGIEKAHLQPPFDLVSLLIGVNNQYRAWPIERYQTEFSQLLQQAIEFAGNQNRRVLVLSIPDWGVTPYASGRDREKIAREIDSYNQIAAEICKKADVFYLWITAGTREAAQDTALLTNDELHPSGKEYERWATALCRYFSQPGVLTDF